MEAIKCVVLVIVAWLLSGFSIISQAAPMRIEICGGNQDNKQCATPPGVWLGNSESGPSGFPLPGATSNASRVCNADETKCIVIPTATGNNRSTPAGWSSPTAPPSTASSSTVYNATTGAGSGATVAEACNQRAATEIANGFTLASETPDGPEYTHCLYTKPGATSFNVTVRKVVSCPTGYNLSGETCNLSNASAVMKPGDGTCEIIRSGNAFSGDAQDPDCALSGGGSAVQPLNGSIAPQAVSAAAPGQSLAVNIDAGTGKTTITGTVASGNGATTTTGVVVLGAPGTGDAPGSAGGQGTKVEGTSVSTGAGTGTLAGSGKLPGEGKDPCGLPGTPACKIDETGTPTDGALTAAKAAYDTATAARADELSKLGGASKKTDLGLSFSIAWPTMGACVDPSFEIPSSGGRSLVIPLCEHEADIKSIMEWLVALLTGVSLFYMGVSALTGRP